MTWKSEDDINDYVKMMLNRLGLKKGRDYNVESSMSNYMKEALRGSSKTKNKTNFGKPDFHIEKYKVPIIFENKLGRDKLVAKMKDGIRDDDRAISNFAVNGALYYATRMIDSDKYNEVIAIGVAGGNFDDVEIAVYYIYGSSMKTVKLMSSYKTLDFLENEESFNNFYKEATLTEEEKHEILITSKKILNEYAKRLNCLMHNHNITAPQRVLYVSGMLLAMRDVINLEGKKIQDGLIPDDLKGLQTESRRDGKIIVQQIEEFLKAKETKQDKMELMLASFREISKDKQRDEITTNDPAVSKFLRTNSSTNAQVFTFIYEYVFKQIDSLAGHIDIIGEMYSEFLKYALGDGKELGIVLTPPYITKMMAEILDISDENRVMDLATGSAGFLISSMQLMIASAEKRWGHQTTKAKERIEKIKREQLLGIELNAEMYVLATASMILRGDGAGNIQKGNSFNRPPELYENFKADRVLLNPPFTFEDNGLPFIAFGLDKLQKGGLGAIIIQDSVGNGKAKASTRAILKKHTLLASIKMPVDLFIPSAGVQTSIYIFKAGTPHNYAKPVKFIDFRCDGYKRTKRGLIEVDNPTQRYQDIIKIYKAGSLAKVDSTLWDLDAVCIEDFINESGEDWNFDQHKKVDKKPLLKDFKQVVSDYLAWDISNVLKKDACLKKIDNSCIEKLECEFIQSGGEWKEIEIEDLFNGKVGNFDIQKIHLNDKGYAVVSSGVTNRGIIGRTDVEADIIFESSITIDMFGNVFARNYPYKLVTHARVFALLPKSPMSIKSLNYIEVHMSFLSKIYGYEFMATWDRVKNIRITLPYMNDELCFSYMEKYIAAIERPILEELGLYLSST